MSSFDPNKHSAAECVDHFLCDLHDEDAGEAEREVVTPHQPEEQSDEGVQDWVPTEAEKDAMARLNAAVEASSSPPFSRSEIRKPQAMKGVKRPARHVSPLADNDDVPNLDEIFDDYDTPAKQRVSICRAYASYLSSMMPRAPKAPKRSTKGKK